MSPLDNAPADVRAAIEKVAPAKRRRDAETLLALFDRATGVAPTMWSTIVAYGSYHYKYASGREGDAPAAGFAPRKSATVVYLNDGTADHADLLCQASLVARSTLRLVDGEWPCSLTVASGISARTTVHYLSATGSGG